MQACSKVTALTVVAVTTGACCCARSTAPPARSPAPTHATAITPTAELVADLCPLHVPDTILRAEDVELGGALVFTTPGDVADLRRRVRLMADVFDHNRDTLARALEASATLPPALRFVEDVAGGARIVFRPADTSALDTFRQQIAQQAVRLARGQCPMLMPPRPQPETQITAEASH